MRKLFFISCSLILISGALFVWIYWPTPEIHLRQASFSEMPGWKNTDARKSLKAFQISCKAFLNHDPEKSVGSKFINLKAKDWYPACKASILVKTNSEKKARQFFETWFTPYLFYKQTPVEGLFTGYYLPLVKGSLAKTRQFNTPIYGMPDNLITVNLGQFDSDLLHHRKIIGRIQGSSLIPYYSRAEINQGAIDKHANVVVWVTDEIERQFLEIEGSGVIELPDGKKLFIGYAGENGRTYTPLANVLIKKGKMTKDNASTQRIRKYFKEHPEDIRPVLNQNESFVFFRKLHKNKIVGSQGVELTPGYSLAVDRKWLPMGVPVWLSTTRPNDEGKEQIPFKRLMIAQDTGGAIKGPVRGDVYWGAGEKAIAIAGHMKNRGTYWILLPKTMDSSRE
ncbi:murein transglycosylase A [Legionella londiniensis]|uniref:Membrane-bound lytic murein transglycosylase A n=1 Tax=Legionella londiniensis TaxID=45068 RepID=A0A0W0VMH1_9GAMM|nr:MltA domain-containing protein [Legionella londiniensis]KTD21260.1 Membrane-bound lytic murein transglycosylase [Legionella londiniensis]STX93286.1 Membrane-bound lytic murein transglycosylase [Legionella londiniensis]